MFGTGRRSASQTAIFSRVGVAGMSTIGALVVLAAGSSSASARAAADLEPGVHVDPGSPAAKQYALPLGQARRTGAAASTRGGYSAALFGAGIKPPAGSGGAGRSSRLAP